MNLFQRKILSSVALFMFLGLTLAGTCHGTSAGQVGPNQSTRDSWQEPERLLQTIGIKPGLVIGEVGAGMGYFTFKIASRLGDSGKIYANDILVDRLEAIRKRAESEGIRNITVVRGKPEDPLFPSAKLDMVFIAYTYHMIMMDQAVALAFLENLKKYLTAETPVVVVDRPSGMQEDSHSMGHESPLDPMISQFESAGYRLIGNEDFNSRTQILIFKLK
ncbi:MAG: class I SAM-dependent methyltransferase [Candidatus Aminicenantes bacterium]|nr:class I SAM-dependent methyltransferase [Candidatus Aminicenantes bacterium]